MSLFRRKTAAAPTPAELEADSLASKRSLTGFARVLGVGADDLDEWWEIVRDLPSGYVYGFVDWAVMFNSGFRAKDILDQRKRGDK